MQQYNKHSVTRPPRGVGTRARWRPLWGVRECEDAERTGERQMCGLVTSAAEKTTVAVCRLAGRR